MTAWPGDATLSAPTGLPELALVMEGVVDLLERRAQAAMGCVCS